jgi:hypothetical protein
MGVIIMIKKLVLFLLRKYLKRWENKLKAAAFDYDCVCLTDEQLEEVKYTKSKAINWVYLLREIIKLVEED